MKSYEQLSHEQFPTLSQSLATFYDFLIYYSKFEKDQVMLKYQNKVHYPKNGSLILFSVSECKSIGSCFHRFAYLPAEGEIDNNIEDLVDYEHTYTLNQLKIEVEIFQDSQGKFYDLAHFLKQSFLSDEAMKLFSEHKLAPLYSEDFELKNYENTLDEHRNFQSSLKINFYLSYWNCIQNKKETFSEIHLLPKNVDLNAL